jgi:hypothetical protein
MAVPGAYLHSESLKTRERQKKEEGRKRSRARAYSNINFKLEPSYTIFNTYYEFNAVVH